MRGYNSIIFLSILCIFSFTCKENPAEQETFNPDFIVPSITPTGNENYLNNDSEVIYDQESLHTFELLVPEDALTFLDNDPAAEEYVEGMLIFNEDTLSPVGIRYKGSIGAFVGCLSGRDFSNPSGQKTCTKLSMKVKIDWEGRDEKFYGLKKLQFHSQNNDPSQMHERLGYWLFREMGVPAPRSVHARLMINNEYSGLYALTEQIDSRFIKHNFDDDDGNLYKEVWPVDMIGNPFPAQVYLDALKTNKKDNPVPTIIRNFGQNISNANDTELPNVIEQNMNLDQILSLVAVDRLIRNDDGPFHWYCNSGVCSNHNFYWYEEPGNETMHLIPWDLDNAFQNITGDSNPVTPVPDAFGETRNDCKPFGYGPWNIQQRSATCDKIIAGWAAFMPEYLQKRTQLINGPFSEARINEVLQAWTHQIREATLEASNIHNDAITISEWEFSLDELKYQVEFARNN
ncbi:MAG: CotH kinase family protein [Balneolaceae bacterium]